MLMTFLGQLYNMAIRGLCLEHPLSLLGKRMHHIFQKAKRQAEVDHELYLNGAGKMIITIPTMSVWRLLLTSALTGAVEHVLRYAYSV